jgi:hypothetical protein
MENFVSFISFYCLSIFVIAAHTFNICAGNALAITSLPEHSKKDNNVDSQQGY